MIACMHVKHHCCNPTEIAVILHQIECGELPTKIYSVMLLQDGTGALQPADKKFLSSAAAGLLAMYTSLHLHSADMLVTSH